MTAIQREGDREEERAAAGLCQKSNRLFLQWFLVDACTAINKGKLNIWMPTLMHNRQRDPLQFALNAAKSSEVAMNNNRMCTVLPVHLAAAHQICTSFVSHHQHFRYCCWLSLSLTQRETLSHKFFSVLSEWESKRFRRFTKEAHERGSEKEKLK